MTASMRLAVAVSLCLLLSTSCNCNVSPPGGTGGGSAGGDAAGGGTAGGSAGSGTGGGSTGGGSSGGGNTGGGNAGGTAGGLACGMPEVCNNADDDCDGVIDNGCDDDHDGYCDARMVLIGVAAICPNSPASFANDCDDTLASVKPGATEVCGDGLDNDCNNLVDTADTAACAAITVDILGWSDPMPISHGRTYLFSATISPADTAMAWPRVWSVIDASPAASCAISDVTLSAGTNAAANTSINVQLPNTVGKLGCIYTLEAAVNGYAKDTSRIEMVNNLPRLISLTNATFDGTVWRANTVAGTTPTFTASAVDGDSDSPLSFNWTGPDAAKLSCAPNCTSSDATAPFNATGTFAAPATPGTYRLTLEVRDGFAATPGLADLVLEVDSCVWVRAGGTGSGATPSTPMGSIQAALDTAKMSAGSTVCVQGTGVFSENLVVPVSPNAPDLVGGFDLTGVVNTQRPVIEVSSASGVTFAPGYAGSLKHLAIRQAAGVPLGTAPAAVVTVADASPELFDVNITVGVGAPPIGVDVSDDAAVAAAAVPKLTSSSISSSATTGPDAVGVRTRRSSGIADVVLSRSYVNFSTLSCPNACRGVWIDRARGTVTNTSSVSLYANTGTTIGIDVAGATGATATAVVRQSSVYTGTANGPQSIAVRLNQTDGVLIEDNTSIGSAFGLPGRQLAAGIADGVVLRDGTVTRGSSTGLIVRGNDAISGGGEGATWRCMNPGDTGEGVDVAAGILLVGTSGATIERNGRTGNPGGGVFGGATSIHWAPGTRRLPPTASGVWTVDTSGVRLEGNEVRAGGFSEQMGCALPAENPPAVAYRDGLPPNPANGVTVGSLASRNLVLDGNGMSCARPPRNDIGSPVTTWCVAAELNAPSTSASGAAPKLTNNSLAATKGNYCVGLRQRGGSGVQLANNTLDADLMLSFGDPPPVPGTIAKYALLLENIDAQGIELVNNIFYAHLDDPYDRVSERLLIREVVPTGTASHIKRLENNLFYIQGDDPVIADVDYVRVVSATGSQKYDSTQLNAIAGVATSSANLAAAPGLTEPANDWAKSTARLVAGSPAIDHGKAVGGMVPMTDIDGQPRPSGAGTDIGFDER